jgi:hypothetical protein
MISENEIRLKLKNDFLHYAEKCLKIRTKKGDIEPFILNKAQRFIHEKIEEQKRETGKVRALILKGRQQGCSTYVGGRYYHQTTHNFGVHSFILTHALDATNNLYKMSKRFYEHTPELVRPQISTNNSKELIFGILDSGYKIGTAENKSVGRSSTIQLFHGSEVAFWSNASEHAQGIMQAVPDIPDTEIILESTANGLGNYFHQMWQKAEVGLSDSIAIFIPWFWQDEYSKPIDSTFIPSSEELELSDSYKLSYNQLNWRRSKIIDLSVNGIDGEKAFNQEYPCNPNEAFQIKGEDSYIESSLVIRARKTKADRYGPLLIGVDPARFGDDRTSIIKRQGRVAFDLVSYIKKDTMEVTGIIHSLIFECKPAKVFIDVGGLGAGIVDRLNELGHEDIITAVNSGSSSLYPNKYINKRAEMWGEFKAWLQEEPCQIPNEDSLHADLCGIRYSFDSNSRLVMEKKEEMKRRGIRSPDEGEALCLTFALPITALDARKSSDAVKSLASDFNSKLIAKKNSWR